VPYTPSGHKRVNLEEIAAQYKDSEQADTDTPIVFRAVVENARNQSAKLSFLTFRQGLSSIQAVVAASDTLSRQMVKFCGSISGESEVLVHGLVKKPFEPVKSATISNHEIHVRKLYIIAKAIPKLPMQVSDAERPLPEEGAAEEEDGRPSVGLATRLNNRVIDLRGKHNHAIFAIKDGVCALFSEYLRKQGFIGVQSAKFLGAPSEGGSNVFEVKYFNGSAYLAQSPQLYKQMLIASRFERVFEIGPIFRAENSNTARHLTEFTGLDLEMAFEEHYHEVMDVLEGLMLYIFDGLKTRYARESELVRNIYNVPDFKLPEGGKVPRIPFSEAVKLLREAGEEIGDYDDFRYDSIEPLLSKIINTNIQQHSPGETPWKAHP
jgi:aspartyl-tRNA synthetase